MAYNGLIKHYQKCCLITLVLTMGLGCNTKRGNPLSDIVEITGTIYERHVDPVGEYYVNTQDCYELSNILSTLKKAQITASAKPRYGIDISMFLIAEIVYKDNNKSKLLIDHSGHVEIYSKQKGFYYCSQVDLPIDTYRKAFSRVLKKRGKQDNPKE